jgi:hypothetical protein
MVEEFRADGVRMALPAAPKRSHNAQRLAKWGAFGYRVALIFAIGCFGVAAIFVALAPESMAQRWLSFVFLGFVPALLAYVIGYLTYWILKGASVLYDPVASVIWSGFQTLTAIGLAGWHSFGSPTLELLRAWMGPFLRTCRPAVTRIGTAAAVSLSGLARSVRALPAIMQALSNLRRIAYHMLVDWILSRGDAKRGRCPAGAFALEPFLTTGCAYSYALWRTVIFGAAFPIRLLALLLIKRTPSQA